MDKAIVVVMFGTQMEGGIKQITNLENKFKSEFKCKVITTFTSNKIRNKIFKNSGVKVLALKEVLFNLANEGICEVVVQPIFFAGSESLGEIFEILDEYKYSFNRVVMGKSMSSVAGVADGVFQSIKRNVEGEKSCLLIGHGKNGKDNSIYKRLEDRLNSEISNKIYIGTLEGECNLDVILKRLKADNVKEIIIKTLLITLGYHGERDIFIKDSSWTKVIEETGIKVITIKESLLDNINIIEFFQDSIRTAMKI